MSFIMAERVLVVVVCVCAGGTGCPRAEPESSVSQGGSGAGSPVALRFLGNDCGIDWAKCVCVFLLKSPRACRASDVRLEPGAAGAVFKVHLCGTEHCPLGYRVHYSIYS